MSRGERGTSHGLVGGASDVNSSHGAGAGHGHGVGSTATAVQAAGSAALDRIVGEVDLCAIVRSTERSRLSMEDLTNEALGHSFVRFRAHPGAPAWAYSTSFGFKPAAPVQLDPGASFGPGMITEPDPTHPSAWMTYHLTAAQAHALFAYKDAHRHAQYSVFFYNCTDFAEGAVRAAGQSVPDRGSFASGTLPWQVTGGLGMLSVLAPSLAGAGVALASQTHLPNNLYNGIHSEQERHNPNAHIAAPGRDEEAPLRHKPR